MLAVTLFLFYTLFRFAAYLNQMQNSIVLFGFAPCGTDFSFSLPGNLRFCPHRTLQERFFSALLPTISGCPSPDHNFCKERGVSSVVTALCTSSHLYFLEVRMSYFKISKRLGVKVIVIVTFPS